MKAIITGGAGFIGSHLVDCLLSRGNSVVVYDNLSSGKKEFIAHHYGDAKFSFIENDLLNYSALFQAMEGCDIVFHLAANPDARMGTINTRLDLDQNTIVTYNVLEAMRHKGVKKIVFTSSGTIYGETADVPIAENYGPIMPISLYGASKVACESLISGFVEIFGMQAWIYRFGNIIGDRATHGVIFDLINKLKVNKNELWVLGDGNQTKPFVYVDDCVDGLLFGLEHAKGQRNIFNLAVPTTTSVKTIVKLILQKVGSPNTLVRYSGSDRGWVGDVPRVQLDIAKLSALGWSAKCSSDEAVAKTIDVILETAQTC